MQFDDYTYKEIGAAVASRQAQHQHELKAFATSWNAVAARFRAAAEHSEEFVRVTKGPIDGYSRENTLFNFVTCALSCLDCYVFSVHCCAWMARPAAFPMATARDLKDVNRSSVRRELRTQFEGDSLVSSLDTVLSSDEFNKLKDLRDFMTHRGNPSINIFIRIGQDPVLKMPENPQDPNRCWVYDASVDSEVTESLMTWLRDGLNRLLTTHHVFVTKHL